MTDLNVQEAAKNVALSEASYTAGASVNGFTRIGDYENQQNGYYGVAYQENSTGKIYIAHRGTDGIDDLVYTDLSFGLDTIPNQFDDAYNFTKQISAQYSGGDLTALNHTGHSLGAGLTKLISAATGAQGYGYNGPKVGGLINDLELHIDYLEGNDPGTSSFTDFSKIIEVVNSGDSVHDLPTLFSRDIGIEFEVNTSKTALGKLVNFILDKTPAVSFVYGIFEHSNSILTTYFNDDIIFDGFENNKWYSTYDGKMYTTEKGEIVENNEYLTPDTEADNPYVSVYIEDENGNSTAVVYGQDGKTATLDDVLNYTPAGMKPANIYVVNADGTAYGNTTHYFGTSGELEDFFNNNFADSTAFDTSGLEQIVRNFEDGEQFTYVNTDGTVSITDEVAGTYQVPADTLFGTIAARATSFAEFMTEVVSGTISEVNSQSSVLIAQIVAGVIAGRDIEDITEEIAVQAVSAGAVKATLDALGGIDDKGIASNDFGKLMQDNALATEAVKGALTAVAVTAILNGSDAGFEDYAKAAASASVSRVVNYGIVNSGHSAFTVNAIKTLPDGTKTVVPTATPYGAGAIAAITTVTSSIVSGNGINEDTLRVAATAAGTAAAGTAIAGALFGTAATTGGAAATAGLFATYGSFAGPAGIIIGAALGILVGNLFKPGGEKVYHNETIGSIFETLPDGTQVIVGVRETGALLQASNTAPDLIGTSGDDVLKGNNVKNIVIGNGGDDMLEGRTSDDVLLGGTGNDLIEAGAGNDYIEGNEDNDYISGGDGDDIILGGSGEDIISGGKGNDKIEGEAGNDKIYGDSGNDIILGGDGQDAIHGGAGDDVISGEDGDDVIDGSTGNDEIHGNSGNDALFGDTGNDILHGGQGTDIIYGDDGVDILYGDLGGDILDGGADSDLLYGGLGKDILFGQGGSDHLHGELGDDYIVGGKGNDNLYGGAGSDVYAMSLGDGQDTIEDSEGTDDIIRLANYTIDEVTLSHDGNNVIISAAPDGSDKVTILNQISTDAIEYLMFSDGSAIDMTSLTFDVAGVASYNMAGVLAEDMIVQTTFAGTWQEAEEDRSYMTYNLYSNWYTNNYETSVISNEVDMELYNDVQVRAAIVKDRAWHGRTSVTIHYNDFIELHLVGTEGSDRIVGFNADEIIYSLGGNDQVYGNSGADTLDGGNDHDVIYGGSQDDTINANSGHDKAYGGIGNDQINGDSGNDALYGQWGVDTIHGNDGDDFISGGFEGDTLYGDAGSDVVYGDDGDDYLYGNDGNDFLIGGAGNDNAGGGAGDDYVEGGLGVDILRGGAGNDIIRGEDGNDNLYGDAGNDLLIGGKDGDYIDGGSENDTVSYAESDAGVTINLSNNTASGGYADGDTILNVENLVGSDYNDILIGDGNANVLQGGYGNDNLYGGAGDDELQGGAGADTLDGGAGWDKASYANSVSGVEIDFAAGTGKYGHAEGDTFVGMERAIGSKFDDKFIIGNSSATFEAGDGYDTIVLQGNAADYTIILDRNILTATRISDSALFTFPDAERLQFDDVSYGLEDFPGDGDAVASITENYAANGVVLQNDNGETIALEINGSNGSVTINGNDTYTYNPTTNYRGSDSFSIRITDPTTGLIRIQNVDVTVNVDGMTANTLLDFNNSLQNDNQITKLNDGTYVVTLVNGVWISGDPHSNTGTIEYKLESQRYDPNFNKIGSDNALISTLLYRTGHGVPATGQSLGSPHVTELLNGNLLYVWTRFDADNEGKSTVYTGVFSKSGNTIVNPSELTGVWNAGGKVDIAHLSNGNTILSWVDFTNAPYEIHGVAYQQLIDGSGNKIGSPIKVNSETIAANLQEFVPKAIALEDGSYISFWRVQDSNVVEGQKFSAGGSYVGDKISIPLIGSSFSPGSGTYDIEALSDTTFIVTWYGNNNTEEGKTVGAQIFDIDGNLIGDRIEVGAYVNSAPIFSPGIFVTENGDFFILFNYRDGQTNDLALQKFDASGNKIGNLVFLNEPDAANNQLSSYIIKEEDDNITVLWGNKVKSINTNDDVTGTSGNDVLNGDSKDELFIGSDGADVINGGDGVDTVSYANSTDAITVDMTAVSSSGGQADGDRLNGIENVIGSSFDDIFIGGGSNNVFDGKDGNDTASYNGIASGYSIIRRGDNVHVTDTDSSNGDDGADTLINIEQFNFTGNSFSLADFPEGKDSFARVLQNGSASGLIGDQATHSFAMDTQTSNGTVVLNPNGTYTYTPNAGYLGTDSFIYIITNAAGLGQAVTVNIEVANEIPISANTLSSFRANESTSGSNTQPSVNILSDDKILVTWGKHNSNGSDGVYGRVFDYNGNALTHDFKIDFLDIDGTSPSDAVGLDDGSFIIFWEDSGNISTGDPYEDGDSFGIFGQKFSSNGYPIDDFFQVNDDGWQDQRKVKADTLSDGNILVTGMREESNTYTSMFGKVIDSDGNTVRSEFGISSSGYMSELTNIKTLSTGGFVATWDSNHDGSGYGAYARVFTNDGTPVTGEILVNTSTFGDQRAVSVEETDSGGFVVVWMDFQKLYENGNQGGDTTNIVLQEFDLVGNKVGGEIIVNDEYVLSLDRTWSNTIFQNPEVTSLHNGTYFVSWSGGSNIYGRVLDSNFFPLTDEIEISNEYADIYFHDAKYMDNGNIAITWKEYDPNNDDYNIRTEILDIWHHILKGTDGNDVLQSGDGDDVVDSGAGDDIITTGLGSDTIKISVEPDAHDVVTDFDLVRDKINLTSYDFLFNGFADLQESLNQNGADTIIDFGNGQTLTVQNIAKENLTTNNFIGSASGNSAPLAAVWTVDADISDGIVNIDVFEGASDMDGDALTLDSITTPINGTAEIIDGKIVYTPNAGYEGYDYIDYTISDGNGGVAIKTLTMNVAQINDAPNSIGTIANSSVDQGESKIIVDASIVQAAFTDIDANDTLTYSLTVNGGDAPEWISIDSTTGQITSDNPGNNDVGSYNLTVTATDTSLASTSQNFAINVLNINDAPTDILLNNTMIDENIASGVIGDLRVADIDIYDHHTFSIDDNRFEIVSGQLKLVDGVVLDFEAEESVTINVTATDLGGLEVTQQFIVGVGNVDDNDVFIGTAGDDNFHAGIGDDYLEGGAGNDFLKGGSGDDTIYAQDGDDSLEGGSGNDLLDGGDGRDVVTYWVSDAAVSVNLETGVNSGGHAEGDILVSIERVAGSELYGDTLTGNDLNNDFYAGGGNDYVYGRGGDDYLYGGEGNDRIDAHDGDDYIDGGTGNDILVGWNGNDSIYGGEGGDNIEGSRGADHIDGGTGTDSSEYFNSDAAINIDLNTGIGTGGFAEGDILISIENIYASAFNDTITGDDVNNYLVGRAGNDTINGEGGDDKIEGREDDDNINGGGGNDTLYGGAGSDTVYGGDGNDFIRGDQYTSSGEDGADMIYGGNGNDSIYGHEGDDSLEGGYGNDYIYGGVGSDNIDGSTGWDVASFTDLTNGITLDLATGNHLGAGIAGDTFTSIESYWGSNFNDVMIGDSLGNYLDGSAGNDTISGNDGNDYLKGNTGDDLIAGGIGNDTLYGNEGNDTVYGDAGDDFLTGWAGNDLLYGGDGNDSIYGHEDDDILNGGAGDDVLYGNEGNDIVYGEAGADFLTGWAGNDVLYGGDGNDSLYGHEDNDILVGGAGADILNGGSGSDTFIISTSTIDDSTTITDFNGGDGDVIDLTSIYNNSISFNQLTLQMSQENNDVVIGLSSGGVVILQNTDLGNLHSDNFIGLAADLIDFDTDYYLFINPDVAAAITAGNFESAYQHYALVGAIEGREPNGDTYGLVRSTDFDAGYYLITNPDVGDAITTGIFESAYQHYVLVGATEGREPNGDAYGLVHSIDFDANYYLITNPDVADAITAGYFESAYQHYVSDGAAEGREPNGDLYIVGDDLNNVLSGSYGNDTIDGGDGNDIIYGGTGADAINGGNGWDVASFTDLTNGITLDLATGNHIGAGVAGDTFTSIESYWGSNFDDVMIGGAGNDNFDGSGGNDTILGNNGNDNLRGNTGSDNLTGGLGADTLSGGSGVDYFNFDHITDSTTSSFDLITDFVLGEDILDFSAEMLAELAGVGINSFADLTIVDNGTDTFITASGTDLEIKLSGIIDLHDSDVAWG